MYAPLVPWLAWCALRERSLTACTAVNPAIPLGGIVGESKCAILSRLPQAAVARTVLVPPGDPGDRLHAIKRFMHEHALHWPIVLKPDVGERGTGVRLANSAERALRIVTTQRAALLAQEFLPGPREAGIFYARHPDWPAGRIFSITDKQFQSVLGDGVSTLAQLISRDPRARLQARVFLERFAGEASRVPAAGERVPLAFAGNHCRGTVFLDGTHLRTRELEIAVDAIMQQAPGLLFGRMDVRFASDDDLRAGRNFRILEMNGLLSESTDMYDPRRSFFAAQRILRAQWDLAYRIGAANARRGTPVATLAQVWRAVRSHRARPIDDAGSD